MSCLSQAMARREDVLHAGCVDGYGWHRAIWGAFPDRPEAGRDFLFRIDPLAAGFRVLLLSRERPTALPWLAWQTKEVAPAFLGHPAYRFQLKANPTMRRAADHRRLGVYDETRLRAWLRRKAEAGGFLVDDQSLTVGAPTDEAFVRGGQRGKHVAVEFAGVLDVTDRERFANAFANGIGAAKSFGFGLLMLKPIH